MNDLQQKRLTQLREDYFTHPDEGGTYLSHIEILELANLQDLYIQELRVRTSLTDASFYEFVEKVIDLSNDTGTNPEKTLAEVHRLAAAKMNSILSKS